MSSIPDQLLAAHLSADAKVQHLRRPGPGTNIGGGYVETYCGKYGHYVPGRRYLRTCKACTKQAEKAAK